MSDFHNLPEQPGRARMGYTVRWHILPSGERAHDLCVVERTCPWCGLPSKVVVPAQGLWDWKHGKHAQQAFPDLTADEREQVLTGTHPDCWDSMLDGDEG